MKSFYSWVLLVSFLTLTIPSTSWSGFATCEIEIKDVNNGSIYKLENNITFKKGGDAQRKHFETPGNDFTCTLAFFDLDRGTMLSCEYNKNLGQTFFQSDRSALSERNGLNNLSFRHQSAFIVIHTRCK